MKSKGVIIGDIIQSTSMSIDQRNSLINEIQIALKGWALDFKFKYEFFRGDSFQCYLENPQMGLRVALLLKTYIRSLNPSESYSVMGRKNKTVLLPYKIIDARITVGIGEADIANRLATSGGTAFSLSGHLLDTLKDTKQTFGIRTNDKYADELETESILLDALIAKTTALQCQVINYKLLGYSEIEIAANVKIIQSAVNQRSTSGSWNAINTMVSRFEKIYSE